MSGHIPFNHKFIIMLIIVQISAEIYCNKTSESRLQVPRVAKSFALPNQTARLSPGSLQILPYIPSPAQCFHRFGKKDNIKIKGHACTQLHINCTCFEGNMFECLQCHAKLMSHRSKRNNLFWCYCSVISFAK